MNKRSSILTAKNTFFTTLFLFAVSLILLAPKAAVNVDELLHYPHAKKVVNWYFTGGEDQSCLNTPETNLKYYGQSVDNLTALFNRVFNVEKEFLVRHYTGALFFLLLLLFSGLLTKILSGSWMLATFSILSLVFMPRLMGQAFGNLKDIPFATGYMAGLLMIVQFFTELPRPRWRTTILLGFAIAFTVSVRAGGFILFPYFGLSLIIFFVLKPNYLKQIASSNGLLFRLMGQGAMILTIGYFAGLIFWPFALQNVFLNPLESLRMMEHYKISIRQVFEGEFIWSTHLPFYYILKWFLISTPLIVLIGFILYLIFFSQEIYKCKSFTSQQVLESFILFAVVFPVFYVIAIGSNLYSGVRQMLFVLPPMAIIAALGIFKLMNVIVTKKKKLFYPTFTLFIIMLLSPLIHQITTFPVDYVYFNVFAGGNKKAWGNYEYDYYFHGMKESSEYLIELVGDENITVAMNSILSNYFDDRPNIKYQYTRFMERSSLDWDYGLFAVNYIHPYLLKNNLWQSTETIKTFYHKGNPVAVLLKRNDKNDLIGISEIKKLNLHAGIELLELALENDPQNVWLHVNIANAKLSAGDKKGFHYYVEMGKKIHPFYEPFFLLEANLLYKEENYRESLQKLNELLTINSRYQPAEQLYKMVNEKLKLNK